MSQRSDNLRRKADERDRRIVERWLDRPRAQRTSDEDVLAFYAWLNDHDPSLIPLGGGSYQHVRTLVTPHIVEKR